MMDISDERKESNSSITSTTFCNSVNMARREEEFQQRMERTEKHLRERLEKETADLKDKLDKEVAERKVRVAASSDYIKFCFH